MTGVTVGGIPAAVIMRAVPGPVRVMIPGVPVPAAVVPRSVPGTVVPRIAVPAVPIPRVPGPGTVMPGTVPAAVIPGIRPVPGGAVAPSPARIRGIAEPEVHVRALRQRDRGRVGGMVEAEGGRHIFGNEEGVGGLAALQVDLRAPGLPDEIPDFLVGCGCESPVFGRRLIVDAVFESLPGRCVLRRGPAGGQGQHCGEQGEKSCFHRWISYIIKNIVSLYARSLVCKGTG